MNNNSHLIWNLRRDSYFNSNVLVSALITHYLLYLSFYLSIYIPISYYKSIYLSIYLLNVYLILHLNFLVTTLLTHLFVYRNILSIFLNIYLFIYPYIYPYIQGRFQSFCHEGARWRANRAESFKHLPDNFLHPSASPPKPPLHISFHTYLSNYLSISLKSIYLIHISRQLVIFFMNLSIYLLFIYLFSSCY